MKNILLGITGGIAAYKAIMLIRLLQKQGCRVRCVLTQSAQTFIGAQTLQAITGEMVRTELFDAQAEAAMGHIELARWADTLVIAPASANTIAKLAHGIADNLLTTLYLATAADILIAPAMNHLMLAHPATQANLAILQARARHTILPTGFGEQACGETGYGRLLEPEDIAAAVLTSSGLDLAGLRIAITAGPTREAVDPVRYISNRSSGKMGYALAAAAIRRGAQVHLITGPTALPAPPAASLTRINSALEMYDAALAAAQESDIFIGAAAVADYRIANPAASKQKKTVHGTPTLELIENPDIIAAVAALPAHRPYTAGFAAETENILEYARAKRSRKHLDMIIANDVSAGVFGADDNAVTIITDTEETALPRQSKAAAADNILTAIRSRYYKEQA